MYSIRCDLHLKKKNNPWALWVSRINITQLDPKYTCVDMFLHCAGRLEQQTWQSCVQKFKIQLCVTPQMMNCCTKSTMLSLSVYLTGATKRSQGEWCLHQTISKS